MKIGFIGLGNVGGKLAGSLLRNGFELHVRDLDQDTAKPLLDQGAIWWESTGSMTREVDVVITCLPSPEASAKVMEEADGILENMRPGMIWAEMSTTDEKE
ncbi:MAG: NAD(P)-binding domain-containing protein, partial [SAR324 cluster bacterium]|nr:NAD(P)-binding domain-containing protein [SAR324 cluster bacterium]